MQLTQMQIDRLWKKIERRGPDECWPFIGAMPGNTPEVGIRGRKYQAARLVYELERRPIPEGHRLQKTCLEPCCCNPGHRKPTPER